MRDDVAASANTYHAHLRPGERVLWAGRPKGRPIGLAPDERAPAILTFGWFGIASYALLWAFDRELAWPYALLLAGVPAAFLALNAARLLRRHRRRRARAYVLTDGRVLWLSGKRLAEQLPLSDVDEVSLHRHGAKTGTVVLGPTSRAAEVLRRSDARARPHARLTPALEDVLEPERVYALLRAATA